VIGAGRVGVDDGERDAARFQLPGQRLAESAVAAQYPVAGRRPVRLGDRRFRQAGQQFDQAEALGQGDGERQMVGEALEGIDDVVGAEGCHVGLHGRRAGAGNDRYVRIEQADGDGDPEVGFLVVGDGQDAPASGVLESGQQQVVGLAGVGGEGRRVGLEVLEIELLDAQLVLFEDDEGLVDAVETAGDQAARLAAAADQVEGLLEMADAAGEAVGGQRVLEALVLEQGDQGDDGVGPGNHGQVDADGYPQALGVGEGVRDFAEADGRRRVADEVEGVEEAERRGRQPFGGDAGNQRQADHRDAVDDDQDDDRRPHAPEDEEEGAVEHAGSRLSGAASRFRR